MSKSRFPQFIRRARHLPGYIHMLTLRGWARLLFDHIRVRMVRAFAALLGIPVHIPFALTSPWPGDPDDPRMPKVANG